MRMEITRIQTSGALELRIRGRLDGYWADHLTNSLAETMRAAGFPRCAKPEALSPFAKPVHLPECAKS